MRVDKSLEWLIPYYESVKYMLPRHYLHEIKVIKPRKDRIARIFGNITHDVYEYSKGKKVFQKTKGYGYYINLYTHYYSTIRVGSVERKYKAYNKMDLVRVFAHELAHIKYYGDHTIDHAILENRIHTEFLIQLEKNGYISEEHELKSR